MDIVSILGLGAIGLGFLLAFLTYRLLLTKRDNNRPIYVFQIFCFALVIVGALLQFSSTTSAGENALLQQELDALRGEIASTDVILERIVESVPTSIANLRDVNAILTGRSCSGGSAGEYLANDLGTKMAALSTDVIAKLQSTEASLKSVLGPE